MSADWSKPTLASKEVEVWDELKERDVSAATMFADTNDTNVPVGAIQLSVDSELVGSFNKFNGASWDSITLGGNSVLAASTDTTGIVELATSSETITGTDTTRAVTPAGLAAKTASATAKGIVELATSSETITGTDTTRAVTPAGLAAKTASATAKGIVELATSDETIAGTDTTRAVTPAGLAAKTASTSSVGLVQLSDSLGSESVTLAATANAVRQAYERVGIDTHSVDGQEGDFQSLGIDFVKVGNIVSFVQTDVITPTSAAYNSTTKTYWSAQVIPAEFRPSNTFEFYFAMNSAKYDNKCLFAKLSILSTGYIRVEFIDSLGGGGIKAHLGYFWFNQTNVSLENFCGTYFV